MDTVHCISSAISAGLGAMTFRNHLRSLNEISDQTRKHLKTAGKIGAGAAALGIGGKLLYDKIKDNESSRGFSYGDQLMTRMKYAPAKTPHTLIKGRGPILFKGDETPPGYLASSKPQLQGLPPRSTYVQGNGPMRPTP